MIIAVTGKAGSGKDEFGKVAVEEFGAVRVAFADGVKEEVAEVLDSFRVKYETRHLYGSQADKEGLLRVGYQKQDFPKWFQDFLDKHSTYTNYYWYFTPRSLLQFYGTEHRRAQDYDYWVKRAMEKVASTPTPLVVMTDCRFPNEADAVVAAGGKVIEIVRGNAPTISNMNHASENALEGWCGFYGVIKNWGSIEEYHFQCRGVLRQLIRGENMSKIKVYLAGPINGCTDEECKYWRAAVTQAVQDWGYEILDPMRRDYRGVEKDSVADIVEGDKVDIQNCDLFLACSLVPSYGTAMEIFYACQLGKNVIVITESCSPWILYHSNLCVKTVNAAIDLLLMRVK